jgi:tape measure domain-containing protein
MAVGENLRELVLKFSAQTELARKAIRDLRESLDRDTDKMDKDLDKVSRSSDAASEKMNRAFRTVAGTLAGVISVGAAAAAARSFLKIADDAKQLESQLRLATKELGTFTAAQADVRRISEETRTALADTGQLYAAFMRNAVELGISQEQAARSTETVNKAFLISGTSAEDAGNSIRQLLQAFQSGTLRGDEFNSMMEGAPRLAKLLADSLGVPIGQLRKMAEAGQLTSAKLTTAFTDARFTKALDEEFKTLPITFDQAMQQVSNSAQITFSAFDRGGQFSNSIAEFFAGGADGMASMEQKAEEMGISISSTLGGLYNAWDPFGEGAGNIFQMIAEDFRVTARGIMGLMDEIGAYWKTISDSFDFSGGGTFGHARSDEKAQGMWSPQGGHQVVTYTGEEDARWWMPERRETGRRAMTPGEVREFERDPANFRPNSNVTQFDVGSGDSEERLRVAQGRRSAGASLDVALGLLGAGDRRAPPRRAPARSGSGSGGTGGSSRTRATDVWGRVISRPGAARDGGRRVHQGYDIAPLSDPAWRPGQDFRVERPRNGARSGLTADVILADGTKMTLMHLAQPATAGSYRAGQVAAIAGNTGNARTTPTHFHVEASRGGQRIDPSKYFTGPGSRPPTGVVSAADKAQRDAERLADIQLRHAEQMEREARQIGARYLSAQERLATAAEDREYLAAEQIRREQAFFEADIRRDADERSAEDPQNAERYRLHAAQLVLLNSQVADLEVQAIADAQMARLNADARQVRLASLEDEQALLQLQGSLAETQADRERIGQRLLNLSMEQERLQLQEIISEKERLGMVDGELRIARSRLASLGERGALQQEALDRENEGPRDRYMRELRNGAANVDEELEQLGVDAMRGLKEETAGAITAMLGLKGAIGGVAERLLSMALDRGIMMLLEALGGGRSAGTGGADWASGLLGEIGGMFGGLFGGGGGVPPGFSPREHGGPVEAGMAYLVGERRPELFVPRQSGFIVPKVPSISVGGGGRGGGAVHHHHNHFQGNLMTPEFWGVIQQGDMAAKSGGAAEGVSRLRRSAARRFPGS